MADNDELSLADEWKESRATLGRFDSTLGDLRKFGFTLVTLLITAGAFLTRQQGTDMPPGNKIAIVAVILLLVTALFGLDRYYWALLCGAAERALDLESGELRNRPVRLTGVITGSARRTLSSFIVLILYLALLTSASGLGVASLADSTNFDVARFGVYWQQLDLATGWSLWLSGVAFALTLGYSVVLWTRNNATPLRFWFWGSIGGVFVLASLGALALAAWEIASAPHYLRTLWLITTFCSEGIIGYFVFTSATGRLEQFKSRSGIPVLTTATVAPGSANLTIQGTDFGAEQAGLAIAFNFAPVAQRATTWTDTMIRCALPYQNPATDAPWNANDEVSLALQASNGWFSKPVSLTLTPALLRELTPGTPCGPLQVLPGLRVRCARRTLTLSSQCQIYRKRNGSDYPWELPPDAPVDDGSVAQDPAYMYRCFSLGG